MFGLRIIPSYHPATGRTYDVVFMRYSTTRKHVETRETTRTQQSTDELKRLIPIMGRRIAEPNRKDI